MTKPFGYYTAHTPGDDSFLESIQQTYGYDFCKISKRDKLGLISVIATQLYAESPILGVLIPTSELAELSNQINENLSVSDRAGLIEAMIAQVRWGQDLVVTEGEVPISNNSV